MWISAAWQENYLAVSFCFPLGTNFALKNSLRKSSQFKPFFLTRSTWTFYNEPRLMKTLSDKPSVFNRWILLWRSLLEFWSLYCTSSPVVFKIYSEKQKKQQRIREYLFSFWAMSCGQNRKKFIWENSWFEKWCWSCQGSSIKMRAAVWRRWNSALKCKLTEAPSSISQKAVWRIWFFLHTYYSQFLLAHNVC